MKTFIAVSLAGLALAQDVIKESSIQDFAGDKIDPEFDLDIIDPEVSTEEPISIDFIPGREEFNPYGHDGHRNRDSSHEFNRNDHKNKKLRKHSGSREKRNHHGRPEERPEEDRPQSMNDYDAWENHIESRHPGKHHKGFFHKFFFALFFILLGLLVGKCANKCCKNKRKRCK